MELAQRQSDRYRRFTVWEGIRLPMDPRPFLGSIIGRLTAAPPSAVQSVVDVANPAKFGYGAAYRREKFFAGKPAYQHGGRDEGDYLGEPEPKPPKVFRPTAAWPAKSRYAGAVHVCGGEAGCEYEPKATGMQRSRCMREWNAHSFALFQAFVDAQGGTGSVQFNRNTRCGCLVAYRKGHRAYGRECRRPSSGLLDHCELARLPGGETFWISQPYGVSGMDGLPDGVSMRNLGRERSWYYPRNSRLLVIGDERTLEKLVFSYPVPTATEPVGCVGWDRVLMSS